MRWTMSRRLLKDCMPKEAIRHLRDSHLKVRCWRVRHLAQGQWLDSRRGQRLESGVARPACSRGVPAGRG